MDTKEKAYQLSIEGLSFGQIGVKLGIGKTTAYNYVKEVELLKKIKRSGSVQNSSKLGLVKNSERIPNSRSERSTSSKNNVIITQKTESIPSPKIKEFTGDDLLKKEFITLDFQGKFLELIGKPSKLFSAVIWGLPKGGKSSLAIRFADYLQEYFGSVLYIAAEEGESATLKQKFAEIKGSKVTIIETRDPTEIRNYLKDKHFNFVFIDSINVAGIESEILDLIKKENPNKSFIAIAQATKSGNFKGDQSLTHNCDFVIKVIDGVAYQEGRFGAAAEMKIFEEQLYQKNPTTAPVLNNFTENNISKITKKELLDSLGDLDIANIGNHYLSPPKRNIQNYSPRTTKKKDDILGPLLLTASILVVGNAILNGFKDES
mgnify:CR=1 FL=1